MSYFQNIFILSNTLSYCELWFFSLPTLSMFDITRNILDNIIYRRIISGCRTYTLHIRKISSKILSYKVLSYDYILQRIFHCLIPKYLFLILTIFRIKTFLGRFELNDKFQGRFEIRNFKTQKWVSMFLSYLVENFFWSF